MCRGRRDVVERWLVVEQWSHCGLEVVERWLRRHRVVVVADLGRGGRGCRDPRELVGGVAGHAFLTARHSHMRTS
jgi:hypothetical protein